MRNHSLDDLYLFVQISQYQNLTVAAKKLDIPLATLSRRLKRLEQQLNCRLIERSAHHFSLTSDGIRYCQLCQPFINGLHNVKQLIEIDRQQLEGHIKITAPMNMTQAWLKHCIYDFYLKHPSISIDLQVQNEKINLTTEQVDVAFRVGDAQEPDWIARDLWQSSFALCASTLYLDQHPTIHHPSNLLDHKLLSVSTSPSWIMRHKQTDEVYEISTEFSFKSNDVLLVRDAVKEGMGISWMPPYYFNGEQHKGHGLVPILPDWSGQDRQVILMYRDRDKQPARVQAFIQHVFDWKAEQPAMYSVN
ncbi:LysR family transcriptional regulator [Moritella sp. 28]|nr:LysR family transcriptional regulator [Moritella sp. 28]